MNNEESRTRHPVRVAFLLLSVGVFAFVAGIFFRLGPTPVANPVVKTVYKTNTVYEQKPNTILVTYDKELKGWPINTAIQRWNKNDRIEFVRKANTYLFEIHISAYDSQAMINGVCQGEAWGCWRADYTDIPIYTGMPKEYRLNVLCHELGHVLGLDHNGHGCMKNDIEIVNYPGEYNLDYVYWTFLWMR